MLYNTCVLTTHSPLTPSHPHTLTPSQCTYINGSPQNTFVPGLVELAQREKVFLGGDDFKSGQTKIKSVLVDFLVSAGLKVMLYVCVCVKCNACIMQWNLTNSNTQGTKGNVQLTEIPFIEIRYT